MPAPVPYSAAMPTAYLKFSIDPDGIDWGFAINNLEMIGMMNSGYVLEANISDPEQRLLNKFQKHEYMETARKDPIYVYFRFRSGPGDSWRVPEEMTKVQEAIITHFEFTTPTDDRIYCKVVAIDPASYYLNLGDASGKSYKGRVDQVIQQVVKKYAPEIKLEIDKTKDNETNRHYMMRQDAKTFIMSLLEWSVPLNKTETNWIVQVDGKKLKISDQGSIKPRLRGYYKRQTDEEYEMVMEAVTETNNALKLAAVKIFSYGTSSTTGEYIDKITDPKEIYTVAKDVTTTQKIIPAIEVDHSFKKPLDGPPDGPPIYGGTHMMPIPEYYTSGDLGLDYRDYIDGRAKNQYLNMLYSVIKMRVKVMGHGEYIDTYGLGTDVIFMNWQRARSKEDGDNEYWIYGYWTVYGFRHKLYAGKWYTELFISRPDQDANAVRTGPPVF